VEFILEPLYKILAQVSMSGPLAQVCPSKHKVGKLVTLDFSLALSLLSFVLLSVRTVSQSSGSSTLQSF